MGAKCDFRNIGVFFMVNLPSHTITNNNHTIWNILWKNKRMILPIFPLLRDYFLEPLNHRITP